MADHDKLPQSFYQAVAELQDLALTAASSDVQAMTVRQKDYLNLRAAFLKNQKLRESLPRPILNNSSLKGLAASLQAQRDSSEGRRNYVTKAFVDLQATALELDGENSPSNTNDNLIDAASWTGIESRAERLRAVHNLLPLAQEAVESLIEALQRSGDNGGPILDERAQALEHLRLLHVTLGNLLNAVDRGSFDDELGEGLAAEAVRYVDRFSAAVKDDPLPYATSVLLLGIFTACGFPGAGALAANFAFSVRKGVQ